MAQSWVKAHRGQTLLPASSPVYQPTAVLPDGIWTYTLEMQTSKTLGPRNELDEYVQTIRGGIIAEQSRPNGSIREIGRIEVEIVQIRRIRDAGLSLSEICGDHSPHLLHMYTALYDSHAGWRIHNSKEFDVGSGSICLIHSIHLDRDWRGYGIGLLAVEGLIRSSCQPYHDVAVLRAHPTEEDGTPCLKATMEKLANHWSLLGFEPCATALNDEGVVEDMYMSLSSLDDSRLKRAVPHLLPRTRSYSRKDLIWRDD